MSVVILYLFNMKSLPFTIENLYLRFKVDNRQIDRHTDKLNKNKHTHRKTREQKKKYQAVIMKFNELPSLVYSGLLNVYKYVFSIGQGMLHIPSEFKLV